MISKAVDMSSFVPLVAQNTMPVPPLVQVTCHFRVHFDNTGKIFSHHPEIPLIAGFCISLTLSPCPSKQNANYFIKG